MIIKVTIKEVAKRAGVSISTVSLAINKQEHVSEELRQKVFDAIQELNYRPNALARSLKNKKSKVIGLVIPDIVNPFFPLMVRGVEDTAKRYGYAIILCNTDGKAEEEATYLGLFEEKCVDGFIFTSSGKIKKSLSLLQEIAIPKVILDRRLDDLSIPTVTVDNIQGAYLATNHLIGNGKRRILFISGPDQLQSSLDRLKGYQQAFEENKLAIESELITFGDFSFESGQKVIKDILARKINFDAVFGANDVMTLGAMVVLSELGIAIPDEIEFIGYDDIYLSAFFKPALTTVKQPAYEMGCEAVKMVLRSMNSKTALVNSKVFKPQLIIRESSPKR
jgi:LacI family transcriptional regulator